VRFTRQSRKITRNQLTEGKDRRSQYYWIFEQKIDRTSSRHGLWAVFAGEVSVTPLHLDPTGYRIADESSHWASQLGQFSRKS